MWTGLWVSGAGGSGVLIARKEDGTWSPPFGILSALGSWPALIFTTAWLWSMIVKHWKHSAKSVFHLVVKSASGQVLSEQAELLSRKWWRTANLGGVIWRVVDCTVVSNSTARSSSREMMRMRDSTASVYHFPKSLPAMLSRAPIESNRCKLCKVWFDGFELNLNKSLICSKLSNIRQIFEVRQTLVTFVTCITWKYKVIPK